MILGLSTSAFTLLHVVLSLIGIGAGFVVLAAMFGSRKPEGWTLLFLATTILTSVTGFFFPADKVLPSHIVGVLSLVLLAIAVLAFYRYRTEGAWRWTYVVTAIAALYLNVFVAVVQAFLKVAFLHLLAPTQADPPFIVTQAAVFLAFIIVGFRAVRLFHPRADTAALRPA